METVAPDAATAVELFTGARSERNLAIYDRAGFVEVEADDAPAGVVVLRKPREAAPSHAVRGR
ncbi:MAG: hypothetical protein PGN29_01505 [Gordonia paraffinivorans]